MKLIEVPQHPAYVVFHDAFDNGAMDVYPATNFAEAKRTAERKQEALDQSGNDEAGIWAAYEKLPRKKVWKYHYSLRELWIKACEFDQIDPASKFVVFSTDNPWAKQYNKLALVIAQTPVLQGAPSQQPRSF